MKWLLGDHLGSTAIVAEGSSGALVSELRYKPWGELRYAYQPTPTDLRYTGQRSEGIGLYFYQSRWYDPQLRRFVQPDSIVPGVGEGDNPNAVGCLGASNYAALTVDYHENQSLDQLSTENKARLLEPDFKLPPVPTNPIAFDRYTYTLNNPIRYTDPSGHCGVFCAAFALPLGPVVWAAVGLAVGATIVIYAVGPENIAESVLDLGEQAGEAVSNGLEVVFASKYVGDPRTAGDIVSQEKQGKIKGEFPSDLLGKTYDEIADLAKYGKGPVRDKARTAKKLLDSNE